MKALIKPTAAALAALLIAGCGGGGTASAGSAPVPATAGTATPTPSPAPSSSSSSIVATSDVTHLPLGDERYSSTPQAGMIYLCSSAMLSGGTATTSYPWFNGDGTYNATTKPHVSGSVSWQSQFSSTLSGSDRIVTANDLPSHTTGTFPISSSDPVYKYDKNPNAIQAQSISLTLPADPTIAAQPSCVGMGAIGIMLTGAALFNGFDAAGHDANANEMQDACAGHPQQSGMYHYHRVSPCATDTTSGHSALMGYALDGFGIYGPNGEDGKPLTDADLDECHGHTHTITWDGQQVSMYHYHATAEFPYTIGCYRGTPVAAPR